jgi:pilus assembly protein CpaF
VRLQGALGTLMERLAQRMNVEQPTESAFPSEQLAIVEELLDALERERVIGQGPDRRFLTEAAISEAVGLGPLDRLLTNRSVREVVVDGPSRILADLGGGLGPVSSFFSSPRAVQLVARRLLARAHQAHVDAPVQEAMLPDGTGVQILQPPLTAQGALLAVRCPPRTPVTAEGLVTEGMLSSEMLTVLRGAMKARRNVLVVGAAGTGVSRVLGALAGLSPEHERVVAVQQAPSVLIDHPQVLPLLRAGAPGLGLGALLGHVQRLRPDRLLVDDVRPEDALALLSHAAGGRGVLLGMHAATAQAGLEQLELFAQHQLGGRGSSLAPLLAQAVHLLLEVAAGEDGVRRVHAMAEIVQADGDRLELRPLFRHDGRFRSTEHRASFLAR